MKAKTRGHRFVLLLYQESMDRIWPAGLFAGLLLFALWFFAGSLFPNITQIGDAALFVGAIICLAIAGFTFFTRNGASVQPFADHFQISTPFLRLKISYRRVTAIRPTTFSTLYPAQQVRAVDRGYLKPYFGTTAVVVDLNDYPFNKNTMRLFISRYLFPSDKKGLILIVKDWMSLSQELDHFSLEWRQAQLRKQTRPPSGYGILDNLSKD